MLHQHRKLMIAALWLLLTLNLNSQIRINEVVASNYKSLYDEEYDTPDWIELYNSGPDAVNLKNYKIYDKNDFENAWNIPDTNLNSGEYLIIYASGKNKSTPSHYILEVPPDSGSSTTTFSNYYSEFTTINGDFLIDVKIPWMRTNDSNAIAGLIIKEDINDTSFFIGIFAQHQLTGYHVIVYKNGETKEIIYPEYPLFYPYTHLWAHRINNNIYFKLSDMEDEYVRTVAEIPVDLPSSVKVGISVNNKINDGGLFAFSNLRINLSDVNFTSLSEYSNNNNNVKSFFLRELHCSFKLSRDGGQVWLWDPNGMIIDSITHAGMIPDVSYGRFPDGGDIKMFFYPSSPGRVNVNGKNDILKTPVFGIKGGLFSSEIKFEISNYILGTDIFQTYNGSEPNRKSYKNEEKSITLNSSKAIKIRAFHNDYVPSNEDSYTFLINEVHTLPYIALTIDSSMLWDCRQGIFCERNLLCKRKIPIWFEYRDPAGNLFFKTKALARIHGFGSVHHPQKSLRIYSSRSLGDDCFRYNFFPETSIDKYDKLLLRNSGNDWSYGYIRDGFMSVLTNHILDVDAAAYKPVSVYLNGDYWGLMNLRERIDEEYLAEKYNIDKASINLVEDEGDVLAGDPIKYQQMYDFIMSLDTDDDKSYKLIDSIIDIRNLIIYSAIEVFSGNFDWPHRNIKIWSSNEIDGKWRWIIHDVDMSLGLYFIDEKIGPNFNFLYRILNPEQSDFSSLIAKLLHNKKFKVQFINTYADLLNDVLNKSVTINIIDSLANNIWNEIPFHHARWDSSVKNWEDEITYIKNYLEQRPVVLRIHMNTHLNLDGYSDLNLTISPEKGGKIIINSLTIHNFPWQGVYFNHIPINLSAVPSPGYKFSHWTPSNISSSSITMTFEDDINISAVFDKGQISDTNIVINEIMYKPNKISDTEDWIELYNAGKSLDISGWLIKDDNDKHVFVLPDNTIFDKETYLVICRDTTKFINYHSSFIKRIGNFDFGFGEDDMVRLFDKEGNLIDIVDYDYRIPWPTNSNGTGNSIELIHHDYDNELAQNWRSSIEMQGTPGRANSTLVDSQDVLPQFSNSKITIYPNPFSEQSTIVLNLLENETLSLAIYNDFDTMLKPIFQEKVFSSGKHYIKYVNENLTSGHYFLRFKSGDSIQAIPFVIIR